MACYLDHICMYLFFAGGLIMTHHFSCILGFRRNTDTDPHQGAY